MTQRVGIVSATGTGRKRTLPALKGSEICVVSTIHGRDEVKLSGLCEEFGVEYAYTDLGEMVKDRHFDFAMIGSPPHLHLEQLEVLLAAEIPVLCEKPLTLTQDSASRVAALSKTHGAPVRVAHHLRHQEAFGAIAELIASGEIGEVRSAYFEWSFRMNHEAPSSLWKLDPALNGPTPLSDAGSHCLDFAIGLFGSGDLRGATFGAKSSRGTVESCDLLTEHQGIQVAIRCSREYGPFSNQLLISGTEGEVRGDQFFTERSSDSLSVTSASGVSRKIELSRSNAYATEVEDFARMLEDDSFSNPGTTVDEAVIASRIMDEVAAELTAQRGA